MKTSKLELENFAIYFIQPVVLTQEQNAGLVLKPEERNVEIVSEPNVDVAFEQFLASVSGTVQCIG